MKQLFFFVVCQLAIVQVFSQRIHFICVTDQSARDIGAPVDREKTEAWLEEMAWSCKMTLEKKFIDVSIQKYPYLKKTLDDLNPGPDDVVFFYFSGHGNPYCVSQVPSPSFLMSPNYCFSLKAVHKQLLEKNPRMLITLFDCCVYRMPIESSRLRNQFGLAPAIADSVRKLFLGYRGDMYIQTNDPLINEYSYGDPKEGGLFTFTFIEHVSRAVRGIQGPASWTSLVQSTTEEVKSEAIRQGKRQEARYFSTLKSARLTLIKK